MNEQQEEVSRERPVPPLTDLQQVLHRPDLGFVPLAMEDRGLLDGLPALGVLTWFHGGRAVQVARTGRIQRVVHGGSGAALLDAGAGLIWIGADYRHALAALNRTEPSERPSLMLFSGQGERMLQVILEDPSRSQVFRDILHQHRGHLDSLRHAPSRARTPPPLAWCPGGILREAWGTATSRCDLQARLGGLGVAPLTAVRALEGLHTQPLDPASLAWLLRRIAQHAVPVHLEVEHAEAVVALETAWHGIRQDGHAWRLEGPDCTLWVTPDPAISAWWIRQGDTLRLEVFDACGARLLTLCPRRDSPRCEQLLTEWESRVGMA